MSFEYRNERTENGRTRLYFLVPDERLVGERLLVLDNAARINAQAEIRTGAYVDVQPTVYSSPDYTIIWGVGCIAANFSLCTQKRRVEFFFLN